MKRILAILVTIFSALVLLAGSATFTAGAAYPAQAQTGNQPTASGPGMQHNTRGPVRFSKSRPLREIQPLLPAADQPLRVMHSSLPLPETLTPQDKAPDTVLQQNLAGPSAPTPIESFDGLYNQNGFVPPDPTGDVGRNHYVQMVNSMFQIFDKSGNSLYGPANINTLFSGLGGACETENAGDPIVVYDSLADRWLLSQFTSAGPLYFICYALSTSPDPTGSYYRYAFSSNVPTDFPDYFKVGVWPDAYYVTANAFGGGTAFAGVDVCGLERDSMLRGESGARQQCVRIPFVPAGGIRTTLPSDIDGLPPPPGTPNYLVTLNDDDRGDPADQLRIQEFKVDFDGAPTLGAPVLLPVAAFDSTFTCTNTRECVPQPPPAPRIDVGSDRIRGTRIPYRRVGATESLLVNHSINVGTGSNEQAGLRWYEIRNPGGTPTLFQQSTYSPDTGNRIYPSIAMDSVGNIAVGYSVVTATRHASIVYTGRQVTDPINTLQSETTLVEGTGSQLATGAGARWGDYSSMVVDPVDECTFWYTTQYYRTTGLRNWRTGIGSFKFPNCTSAGTPTAVPTINATPPTATPTAGASPTACAALNTFTGSITTDDPTMVGRVSRAHPPSSCPTPSECAATAGDAFVRHYDVFTYTNSTGASQCVTVTVDNMCGDNTLASVAYLNSYNPASICTNYLADWGDVGGPNYSYSFNLAAGAQAVIVLHELSGEVGCPNYRVHVGPCGAVPFGPNVTATPTASATATATACPIQFQDVPQSDEVSSFYPFVRCLACRQIVGGYPCGGTNPQTGQAEPCGTTSNPYYRPGNNITRGQISKIVSESAGYSGDAGAQIYADVAPGDPFYVWINRLSQAGVMGGYPCGGPGEPCQGGNRPYFRPGANASRGQLSKIVSNAAGFNDAPVGQTYADVPPSNDPSSFYPFIERLSSRGVMGGYPCGSPNEPCGAGNRPYFRPNNPVTRAQAAKIVANTFYPNCQTPARP
ncbi:MAG: S-layer homology domain-containing protein [Chloroflexota bacterium]|nr:S-layer homology domain-containing protein [Chloroflexota bacterium]MDQ5866604.1 S-layer homology domain-containing protein [Chloroflexota bacterium]